MLAHSHRLRTADDFRQTIRHGKKYSGKLFIVYAVKHAEYGHVITPQRFGYILSKKVGNAVTRNTVKRRLRAVNYDFLTCFHSSPFDIVIRVHSSAARANFLELSDEMTLAFRSLGVSS